MPSISYSTGGSKEVEEALMVLEEGLQVRRIKRRGRLAPISRIYMDGHRNLNYHGFSLNVSEMVEVREGYNSDGLHRASKNYKFQETAPESACFSIIYKHPKFVYKSVNFVARGDEQKRRAWIDALKLVMAQKSRNPLTFDESAWLRRNLREADLNKNGEIEFTELWRLLSRLNLQLSEVYVYLLFKDITSKKPQLTEPSEFFRLFEVLTDLSEYRHALRQAAMSYNSDTQLEECLDVDGTLKFLEDEQNFKSLDRKKVEAIIDTCNKSDTNKLLCMNGFRRLLQSRWGNILKEGHESVFQDMDKPLPSYFIKSSHNTYLTGLQVRGNASVEGYISALQRGNRLLELDIFDGENGEPAITHKRTFIGSISLRNVLKSIAQYAFQFNPYPVILTIENHVGLVQQRAMADIFINIFGEMLYIPGEGVSSKPLPSPNQLKNKILLRGKTSSTLASAVNAISDNVRDEDDPDTAEEKKLPRSPIDPTFGRLIALPSVKLSINNIYNDIKEHPMNGSPSVSESKVLTYLEAAAPIATYTASRLLKSYPKGIRQDSSNMSPVSSWLCGIQAVAMNCQTCDDGMDLVNGLFSVNGNVGYVLKPKVLLDGIDPRTKSEKVKTVLQIAVICGNYLPKPEAGKDIVDPFVSVEVFGIPPDSSKAKTRAVKNNGFNPVWNETFSFPLRCPEMAILRLVVKDFDSTSTNDFIGEFSVPISSIRAGYSQLRLNTGFEHSPDDAASLFVRVAYEDVAE